MSMPPEQAVLGPVMEAFKRAHGFSDHQLAHWLGLAGADLPMLAARQRPAPSDPDFHEQCRLIAQETGCDAFALRTMLRWLFSDG